MAGRKIIWSHSAKIKLLKILEYYSQRNKSSTYSAKLYKRLNLEIKKLVDYPELGRKTEITSIRGLIVKNYTIFYEAEKDVIIVHTIWDNRQNPDDLTIK